MKVWLLSVGVLFVLVELYQWAKAFTLPLPIFVLAGAFLAIASNYDKGLTEFRRTMPLEPTTTTAQTATLIPSEALPAAQPPSSLETKSRAGRTVTEAKE